MSLVLTLAGCGRVGFDASSDAASSDSATDTSIAIDTQAPVPTQLVYLPFDDDPADGADNRGTASTTAACREGCPTLTAGKRGNAYQFDGASGLVLPRSPELALARGTVMAWVRLDALPIPSETFAMVSFPFGATNGDTVEIFIRRDADDVVRIYAGGDAGTELYTLLGWPSPAGVWAHVALVWDQGGTERLVIDGTTRTSAPSLEPTFDMHDLFVGCDADADMFLNPWRGALDDFVISDRALTDAEITAFSQGVGL